MFMFMLSSDFYFPPLHPYPIPSIHTHTHFPSHLIPSHLIHKYSPFIKESKKAISLISKKPPSPTQYVCVMSSIHPIVTKVMSCPITHSNSFHFVKVLCTCNATRPSYQGQSIRKGKKVATPTTLRISKSLKNNAISLCVHARKTVQCNRMQ
jgi:hypothetical protein